MECRCLVSNIAGLAFRANLPKRDRRSADGYERNDWKGLAEMSEFGES